MEIDEEGLEGTDRELLHAIAFKFDGGPVGLSTLAVTLGEGRTRSRTSMSPTCSSSGFSSAPPAGA